MGFMIVLAEHCSSSPWSFANFSTMTYENIANAFTRSARDGLDGSFVGPGPRVVRRSLLQEAGTLTLPQSCPVQTSAAWLFSYPDPPAGLNQSSYVSTIQRQLRADLGRTLESGANNVGGMWAPPTFVAYDPALHGPLEFWTSGQAGNTRTRNGADAGQEENRVGPDASERFQRRETASDFIDRHKFWLLAGGAVVAVGAVGFVAWRASRMGVFGPLLAPGPVGQPYYPPSFPGQYNTAQRPFSPPRGRRR